MDAMDEICRFLSRTSEGLVAVRNKDVVLHKTKQLLIDQRYVRGLCDTPYGILYLHYGSIYFRDGTLFAVVASVPYACIWDEDDREVLVTCFGCSMVVAATPGRWRMICSVPYPTGICRVKDGRLLVASRNSIVVVDKLDMQYKVVCRLKSTINSLKATADGGVLVANEDVWYVSVEGTPTLVFKGLVPIFDIEWDGRCLLISDLVRSHRIDTEYLPLIEACREKTCVVVNMVKFGMDVFHPYTFASFSPHLPDQTREALEAWAVEAFKDSRACFAALYEGTGRAVDDFAPLRHLTGGARASKKSGACGPFPIRQRFLKYLIYPTRVGQYDILRIGAKSV